MSLVSAHLAALAYGLVAALSSLAIFYLIGRLVVPGRWQSVLRWPDALMLGLTLFVVLCRIAIGWRNMPIKYVLFVLAAIVCVPALNRLGSLRRTLADGQGIREARRWMFDFSILYVLAYILTPSAGPAFLPLGPGDNVTLVTFARYARQLFESGTASIEIAPFDYSHSPASMYALAWQSLAFGRDPLQAAMPTLLLAASLYGMVAAETARTVFGLTHRGSMAIACVVVSGPLFRWMLGAYGLAEVLAAIALLYMLRAFWRLVVDRSAALVAAACAVTGGVLLLSVLPPPIRWGPLASIGVAALLDRLSPASLLGFPARTPTPLDFPTDARFASILVLALVPVLWAAVARGVRGIGALDLPGTNEIDRRLARALAVYATVGLTAGNVVVYAVSRPTAARRTTDWRRLDALNPLPFRAFRLKVSDEPGDLSTALVLYYLPGRKAQAFGRAVDVQALPLSDVSKDQPFFIQNFGCDGAGHSDAVEVERVGCLLMAPPSMTLETSYPFNQTFLFLDFDHMTPREAAGRWNTRPTLQLQVKGDSRRVPLERDLFLNFLLNPMTPEGTKPRQLAFSWGVGHRGQVLLGERGWFTLPVQSGDWKGSRLRMLAVAIDFLDGRAVLFNEIALTDEPRGLVVGEKPN